MSGVAAVLPALASKAGGGHLPGLVVPDGTEG